ncbi:MAG TPA: RteC domain-containing protein [Bacteroidia bacterium]
MNYTDDYFEALKIRFIQKLRFARNKFLKEARNTDAAVEAFGLGFILTSEMELDEFSKKVSENFNWLYDIGRPIEEILNGLIDETRINFLNELALRPQYKTVKVRRTLWKIKLPFPKYYETYDYKGELKERFKVKINWNKENLLKLAEAKSKLEKELLFSFLFVEREYIYQKPIPFQTTIINPEVTDTGKWFKALVKYRANKEFMPELYVSELPVQEQQVVAETKEKRKKETIKLLKWTDGKTKNNFPKLIYALSRAGLLENGKGEITKIVDKLAPVFGLELGDWESNFSSGITGQSLGYDHGAFFDNLKNSYLEIVDERLEKKKKKKSIHSQHKKKNEDGTQNEI